MAVRGESPSTEAIDLQRLFCRYMTKKGRRFELDLAAKIYEASNHELLPSPHAYSGNHRIPSPDISVDDGTKIHAFELKKTGEDRQSFYYDPDDRQRDDVYQLLEYARQHPRTIVPYLGVSFDRRQLVTVPLWLDAPNDIAAMRSATKASPCEIKLTYADNLSFRKPDTDVWPSAQNGDDAQHVLEMINHA